MADSSSMLGMSAPHCPPRACHVHIPTCTAERGTPQSPPPGYRAAMDAGRERSAPAYICAMLDPQLLRDPRVLMNLLAHERQQRADREGRECCQSEVTLDVRKELAYWMMQVCEFHLCEEGVFPLAMSYVRTCLSLFPVHSDQMRLLGATCLLLASKMKNAAPLSLAILQHHTGYTVTSQQIRDWELFVLKQLRWDLAIIIPHDFLDYMLERVFFTLDLRPPLRKNAAAYLTLCCADCNLCRFAPSTITGVCIAKAMWDFGFLVPPADDFYTYLSSLTEATTDEFLACKTEIENALCTQVLGDHTYVNSSQC